MRIAIMVRSYVPIPRPTDMIYAPIDLAQATAEGLAARGHKVTLFAPLGSHSDDNGKGNGNLRVETLNMRALAKNQEEFSDLIRNVDQTSHYVPALWDKYMSREILRRAARGEFDIVHFHHPEVALDIAGHYPHVPIVYTLHDPVYPWYKELFELYQTPNQHFISISNNQRRDAPDLPYAGTVYNGVHPQGWPLSTEPEGYLLSVGRIVPEKGVKEAIQVAKATGHRLLIIGPAPAGAGQDYFDQYIKPQLDDQILHLGFVERSQLWRYYQKAKALLTPVQWEEPFGMTSIEAMACGTPVLSLDRGAAPEIIQGGTTGFTVGSIGEMVEAVGAVDDLNRNDCRTHVTQNFSVSNMVDGHLKAYHHILHDRTPRQKLARNIGVFRRGWYMLPGRRKRP